MSYKCEYCDKKPKVGNQIEIRGKAKYLGGVGTKVTGITTRRFMPNLQKVRITTPNGTTKSVRVCTKCLKTGVIRKAVKQRPFHLPTSNAPKPVVPKAPKAPKVKAEKTGTPKAAATAAKTSAPKKA